MDMIFHWLYDRDTQKQFRLYWIPGTKKRSDYWTKRHCMAHHQAMRPDILTLWMMNMTCITARTS